MLFTILIFFLVLSILVLIHELGHFFVAKLLGVKVEEFGFGLPPRIFGVQVGETLYSLNALPFGGFVKVFGEEMHEVEGHQLSTAEKSRSFVHKKPWQKISVLVAGVALNFVLGWFIVSYLFTRGVPVPSNTVRVLEVSPDSPAQVAGLQKNDSIVRVIANGKTSLIKQTEDVSTIAAREAGKEILLIINRNGTTLKKSITPRKNPPKGQGALGVAISSYTIKKYTPLEAPFYGLIESAKITGVIGKELGRMALGFITLQKPRGDIAGPVGIAQLTSEAARQGLDPLLQLIGLLSLNLAVLNILPFPALDGGRLMFVLYETVTKRRMNPKIEQRLNYAGFALLISLLILVTINDIIRLIR